MTEADECNSLKSRLDEKQLHISYLKEELDRVAAAKAAAHQAGLAGIKAAKTQLERLRAELVVVRRWKEKHEVDDGEGQWQSEDTCSQSDLSVPAQSAEAEENKTRANALRIQARSLRHDLGCLKHQVDCSEAKRPRQEDEIMRLKAELVHTLDILDSTRHEVKHHEIERNLEMEAVAGNDEAGPPGQVGLQGGGHGSIEAHAERHVRGCVENKNIRLSGKAKRLTGVVAAQQLLIQRLEKQLVTEEQQLGRKDEQLYFQAHRFSQLKNMVRKNSDNHVAKMLGVSTQQPNMRKASTSKPGLELYQSASVPRLPPIER